MKTYEKVGLAIVSLDTMYKASFEGEVLAYTMKLSRGKRGNKQENFRYYTGIHYEGSPNAKDLLSDLVRNYNMTHYELQHDLGYTLTESSEALAIIKHNNEKLERLFSSREIKALRKELVCH